MHRAQAAKSALELRTKLVAPSAAWDENQRLQTASRSFAGQQTRDVATPSTGAPNTEKPPGERVDTTLWARWAFKLATLSNQ
jgi:hypothetical protein